MHTLDLAEVNAADAYHPLFGYTTPSLKYTHEDQKAFYTWYGLRLWYITGRRHDALLDARTVAEAKAVNVGEWLYVADLESLLLADLDHNAKSYPLLLTMLRHYPVEVTWSSGKVNCFWRDLVKRYAAQQYRP